MNQFAHDPAKMMTRVIDRESPVVIVDIGANVGDTCAAFLQEFPFATVFAIEPVSDVFETLQQRVQPGDHGFLREVPFDLAGLDDGRIAAADGGRPSGARVIRPTPSFLNTGRRRMDIDHNHTG